MAAIASLELGVPAGSRTGTSKGKAALSKCLHSRKSILLDCDGVLWRGKTPIPGSAEAILKLQRAGKQVVLLTNNSTKSRSAYVHKVKDVLGIDVAETAIFGSAFAAAKLLQSKGVSPGSLVYVVGEEGLHEELKAEGFETIGQTDSLAPFNMDEFTADSLDALGDVKAVVVGLDTQASYAKIARASALARKPGVRFFATNGDSTFPAKDTLLPGAGAVLAAVAAGAGRPPEAVAGKPSPALLGLLKEHAGVDPATALMVGDRLNTDILFGNQARDLGMQSLLVLTGISTQAEVEGLRAKAGTPGREGDGARGEMPSFVCDCLGDVVSLLESNAEGAGEATGSAEEAAAAAAQAGASAGKEHSASGAGT